MLRINPRQLEEVKRIYPFVKTTPTKHGLYITNIQLDNEAAFIRCMRGKPSNRQQAIAEKRKTYQMRHHA